MSSSPKRDLTISEEKVKEKCANMEGLMNKNLEKSEESGKVITERVIEFLTFW